MIIVTTSKRSDSGVSWLLGFGSCDCYSVRFSHGGAHLGELKEQWVVPWMYYPSVLTPYLSLHFSLFPYPLSFHILPLPLCPSPSQFALPSLTLLFPFYPLLLPSLVSPWPSLPTVLPEWVSWSKWRGVWGSFFIASSNTLAVRNRSSTSSTKSVIPEAKNYIVCVCLSVCCYR